MHDFGVIFNPTHLYVTVVSNCSNLYANIINKPAGEFGTHWNRSVVLVTALACQVEMHRQLSSLF